MIPVGTPALEFIALDKEGGVKKVDDVIGGGVWNCAEATSRGASPQPFQTFVPITFEGKTAGRIILEVQLGGSGFGGGFGSGMIGSNIGGGIVGSGIGGGYAARTTTTTNGVIQGGYTSMYPGQNFGGAAVSGGRFGSTLMAGSPYPVGGVMTSSFVPPPIPPPIPPGVVMSNLGGGLRPQSPTMINTRPISPVGFVGGQPPVGFVGGQPPVGFPGAPVINRPSSVFTGGPQFGAPGASFGAPGATIVNSTFNNPPPQQVVETTTTTISNGPPPIQAAPVMTSGIMNSGIMNSGPIGIPPPPPPPMMNSGLRGSFANGQVTTVTTSSNIAPQPVYSSGLRRSGVGLPPLPPAPVFQATNSVLQSGIHQNYGSNIIMNQGPTGSYIAPGATTTVTEVTEVYNNPGPTMTSNIGGNVNALAGVAGVAALGATGALGASGFNQTGFGAVGPVASVGGGAMMPGPTGMGVDMAGRLVDMGRIRLEKIEHYPSYNLFSMLDDHPPMAAFRVMPHKLRNY